MAFENSTELTKKEIWPFDLIYAIQIINPTTICKSGNGDIENHFLLGFDLWIQNLQMGFRKL